MAELVGTIDPRRDNLSGNISINRFASDVRAGRVQEVMTTSDFAFMADLIDRGTKQGYLQEQVPVTWPMLGWRRDSATFEDSRDYEINAARLIPTVPEKGEYLPIDPTFAQYDWHMAKYGCQWDVSWEAWLRDGRDLNLLRDYPMSWGLSARYTREYVFTQTWAASAVLFTAGQGNLWAQADFASGDALLNAANLGEAIAQLRSFTDPAGNVAAYLGPLYLVVPPALEFTAKQLVNSQYNMGGLGVTSENNTMYNAANVVVNHFLPTVDAVSGNQAWYLFCSPSLRPAVRYGYLRGYEEPEIFVKEADARALMGGSTDPFEGSFATDDIEFKLRFTFGTGLVDWRGAFMSLGDT